MIDEVVSRNGIAIRLTDERWAHITEEQGDDGFIITAFLTSKARSLAKRRQVWP